MAFLYILNPAWLTHSGLSFPVSGPRSVFLRIRTGVRVVVFSGGNLKKKIFIEQIRLLIEFLYRIIKMSRKTSFTEDKQSN